jgi:hypothetical protein
VLGRDQLPHHIAPDSPTTASDGDSHCKPRSSCRMRA